MSVETWNERAPAGAAAAARIGKLRPRLGFTDLLLQLWRAKWLMLMVSAPIALAGLAFALLTPATYTANTRLLVRFGQESVLAPVVGGAPGSVFPQQDVALQAEAELARSPAIAERVIAAVGLNRLYPRLGEARLRARNGAGDVVGQGALEAFASSLEVGTVPRSSILYMAFTHEDPDLAAATLNRLVPEYLKYRTEILSGHGADGLAEQRAVIEQRLAEADKALQAWLASHNVSDFDAETAAAKKLYSDIRDEQSRVGASLRETEARSASLSRQMTATPRDVDLFVETTFEQDLVKLKLERENLLTRDPPDSLAVKDIERRIEQLEGFVARAPAQGLRRIGLNPTFQALDADRAVQVANTNALTGRAAALATQKLQAEAEIARLATLEPDYLRLKRDRDALEASAEALAAREQTDRARSELAARNADDITVYEPARAPTQGDLLRRTVALGAGIFGMLCALGVGLLRAWSAPAFATARSAERTLGLPVLAATRDRG